MPLLQEKVRLGGFFLGARYDLSRQLSSSASAFGQDLFVQSQCHSIELPQQPLPGSQAVAGTHPQVARFS